MSKAHATLGLLSPRPGDAHRDACVDLDVSTNDHADVQTVWACEACVPRQQAFVRHTLTPGQARILVRIRGEQGNVGGERGAFRVPRPRRTRCMAFTLFGSRSRTYGGGRDPCRRANPC